VAFAKFKRWLADQTDRDPMKIAQDALQAQLVEQLVTDCLPYFEKQA
jgi:hypothetical protein